MTPQTSFPPQLLTQLRLIQSKLNQYTIGSPRPTDAANNNPIWNDRKEVE